MDKQDFIAKHIGITEPKVQSATAYAPSNIALVKYWGKRNQQLNLPVTDSLSISLANKGSRTTITAASGRDRLVINGQEIQPENKAWRRLTSFLDYFRPHKDFSFSVNSISTVPVGCGLASSASGFAALVLALDKFFVWNKDKALLSAIARMGSGSASRSLWHGFVHWQKGKSEDGIDSIAQRLAIDWPELCVGLLVHETTPKKVSSTEGMIHTQETSPLFSAWPDVVAKDIVDVKHALFEKDFACLGRVSEQNAEAMHAVMLAARPQVSYFTPQTVELITQIKSLRSSGLQVYYTQDAGPNIKLLFESKDLNHIQGVFPSMDVVKPFAYGKESTID